MKMHGRCTSFRGLGGNALETARFMRFIDGKLASAEQ
jgi:hypothetical protein